MEQLRDRHDPSPLVLIVDDNPTIRHVVAQSLHFGGFQPVEAANGLEAITWMESAARESLFSSVILLDLAMPGMDGRAFLKWLQTIWVKHYPLPAIILITASSTSDKTLTLFPAIKQIIAKPFHLPELIALVNRWSV